MKKNLFSLVFFLSCVLLACGKEAIYTLKESEIDIEVSTKDFNPVNYLLKDNELLSEEEKKKVKTGAMFDIHELGDYTFTFPDYQLSMRIHVVDTQKPTLSIIGFRIKQGNIFTWNEESLEKLKAQVDDNYEEGDLLKKSLHCSSVDTTTLGSQTIICQIEDSSGNIGTASTEIEVLAGEAKDLPTNDIPEEIQKPKPIIGFD